MLVAMRYKEFLQKFRFFSDTGERGCEPRVAKLTLNDVRRLNYIGENIWSLTVRLHQELLCSLPVNFFIEGELFFRVVDT